MRLANQYFLFLIISLLVVYSCSEEISPKDQLLGLYEVMSIETFGCTDDSIEQGLKDVAERCEQEDIYIYCKSLTIEFNSRNEFITSEITKGIDRIGIANEIAESKTGYFLIRGNELDLCLNGLCEKARFVKVQDYLELRVEKQNGCSEIYRAYLIE